MRIQSRYWRGPEFEKEKEELLNIGCSVVECIDKFGKFTAFEFDGDLNDFFQKYKKSFQVKVVDEKPSIVLGLEYYNIHDGIS